MKINEVAKLTGVTVRTLHYYDEIKEIISNPKFDKTEALTNQKELLIKKRQRIDKLIKLADSTLKGENNMSFKEFDMTEIEKTKNYNKEKWQ